MRRSPPARLCPPPAAWPEADRRLWDAALRPANLLQGRGSLARSLPIPVRRFEEGYGRGLPGLAETGSLGPARRPGERIAPGAVGAYRDGLMAVNAGGALLGRVQQLHGTGKVMG